MKELKFINSDVAGDIDSGRKIKLNLGGGTTVMPGFYNLDHVALDGVDIVASLDEPLDLLPDNSVSEVYTRHALEHVDGFMGLMEELYRVAAPGAVLTIVVPHFSNPYYYSDPTHVRFFGLYTMYYFVDEEKQQGSRKLPPYYSTARFKIDKILIRFYKLTLFDRLTSPLITWLVNRSIATQDFFERRLSGIFHAWEIRYVLRPDK